MSTTVIETYGDVAFGPSPTRGDRDALVALATPAEAELEYLVVGGEVKARLRFQAEQVAIVSHRMFGEIGLLALYQGSNLGPAD